MVFSDVGIAMTIKKPSIYIFQRRDNPEISHQFISPLTFKDIENKDGNKMGLQISQIFPQTLCLQVSILIIHWHRFQVSYAGTQLKQKT